MEERPMDNEPAEMATVSDYAGLLWQRVDGLLGEDDACRWHPVVDNMAELSINWTALKARGPLTLVDA